MPRADYKTCKECRGHINQVGPLSHRRLCKACGLERSSRNFVSLTTRHGTDFLYWRTQMAASVGAVLVDDLNERA